MKVLAPSQGEVEQQEDIQVKGNVIRNVVAAPAGSALHKTRRSFRS